MPRPGPSTQRSRRSEQSRRFEGEKPGPGTLGKRERERPFRRSRNDRAARQATRKRTARPLENFSAQKTSAAWVCSARNLPGYLRPQSLPQPRSRSLPARSVTPLPTRISKVFPLTYTSGPLRSTRGGAIRAFCYGASRDIVRLKATSSH